MRDWTVSMTTPEQTGSGSTLKATRNHDRRFLLISSQEKFDALGENRERCIALCAEHDLHIVTGLPGDRYKDHVSGSIYEVYVSGPFPGSADDAATYGALALCVVQPEGSPDR